MRKTKYGLDWKSACSNVAGKASRLICKLKKDLNQQTFASNQITATLQAHPQEFTSPWNVPQDGPGFERDQLKSTCKRILCVYFRWFPEAFLDLP